MEILVFLLISAIIAIVYFYNCRVNGLKEELQARKEATAVYLGVKVLFRDVAMTNLLRRIPKREMDSIYAEAVDGLTEAENAIQKVSEEGSVDATLEARREFFEDYHRKLKEVKNIWDRIEHSKDVY